MYHIEHIYKLIDLPILVTGNVLSLADKDSINMNGMVHIHTVK